MHVIVLNGTFLFLLKNYQHFIDLKEHKKRMRAHFDSLLLPIFEKRKSVLRRPMVWINRQWCHLC